MTDGERGYYTVEVADEYGNTGHPPAILECQVEDQESLLVLAPPEFARRWPRVHPRYFLPISESHQPARMISRAELTSLWGEVALQELEPVTVNRLTFRSTDDGVVPVWHDGQREWELNYQEVESLARTVTRLHPDGSYRERAWVKGLFDLADAARRQEDVS